METIFTKIEQAVKEKCKGVQFVHDYPKDFVKLDKTDDEIIEDNSIETMKPLADAMQVILDTIKEHGSDDDDLRVCFCHLPAEEYWGISIGDGR